MVLSRNYLRYFFIFFISFLLSSFIHTVLPLSQEESKILFQLSLFISIVLFMLACLYKHTIFKPLELLVLITACYFLAGGVNWIERGRLVDYYNEYLVLIYLVVLLFSVNIGYFLYHKRTSDSKNRSHNLFFLYCVIFLGLIFISLDWIIMGGVPLFFGNEIRHESQPIFRLGYLAGLFSTLLLFHKNRNYLFILLYLILAILSGYRTFVLVYMLAFFHYIFNFLTITRFKKVVIVFSGLGLFFMINTIKLYRDIQEFGLDEYIEILNSEGLSKEYLYLSPVIHTVREGPQIFQRLRDSNKQFGYGGYFIENISTILPGDQRGYGLIYNELTNAPTNNTKTGTILGAYYIDGGILSIIIFTIFSGFLIGLLSRVHKEERSIESFFHYSIYVCFLTIWTHGGSPYTPTFFLLVISCFILTFSLRVNFFPNKIKNIES